MGIPEDEVELAINHVKLAIAVTLLLINNRPIGEDFLKRAITIIMQRQMDNMLKIENDVENYEEKTFEAFMQDLEERYERIL